MPVHSELTKFYSLFEKFEEQCSLLDVAFLCLKPDAGDLQVMGLRVTATTRTPWPQDLEDSSFLGVRRSIPVSELNGLLQQMCEGRITLDGVCGHFPPHSNWSFSRQWLVRSRLGANGGRWPTVRAYGSGSMYKSAFADPAGYLQWLASIECSEEVHDIRDLVARLGFDEMTFHSGDNQRVSHVEMELPLVATGVGCRAGAAVATFSLGRGSLSATVKCFGEGGQDGAKAPLVLSSDPREVTFPLASRNGRFQASLKLIAKGEQIWDDHVSEVAMPEAPPPGPEELDPFRESIGRSPTNDSAVDVVLICALKEPELAQVRRIRGTSWAVVRVGADDPHTYEETRLQCDGGLDLRIVAGTPNQMGPTSAAVLATKMILRFRPKMVVLAGIAAGVDREGLCMGDILAAEHTVDYGAGKITEEAGVPVLRPDPKPLAAEQRLLSRLKHWEACESGALHAIRNGWPARSPQSALRLHVGPLGSGSAVIASRGPVQDAQSHWRKLVGIEMEAYGVHRACADAVHPSPVFFCAKSVCDFADANKNDQWQDYAAFTSAEFVFAFLRREWRNLFLEVPAAPAAPREFVW